MRPPLLATALGLLVIGASAQAMPAVTGRFVWTTGQLVAVDADLRTIEVRQGDRELPFTITAAAHIVRDGQPLRVTDLRDSVGRRVTLRYTLTHAARLADRVEVLDEGERPRH